MKKTTLTYVLVIASTLWSMAQTNELGIRALNQLYENDVEKIWTGDLDHYGQLIFSVTEMDNPIGMWEYEADDDEDILSMLTDEGSIFDLVAYQSEYGLMHRVIYFLQRDFGTSNTTLRKLTSLLRNVATFDKLMYGVEVSNVLNSGDIIVWGDKANGETYDLYGNLTGFTRNGVIHGLLNEPDSLDHRSWVTDDGTIIPGDQFCALYQIGDSGKIIGGFGPDNGEGYATILRCSDGTSAFLDDLPQPEEVEYSWMGVVPHVGLGNGVTRFMAAGLVTDGENVDYQLLIWNEDLTDYEVYQSFGGDFEGRFRIGQHVVDENNGDALALGGDNIDLENFGYPANYSGLIFINSSEWKPLEEILGYAFLDNSEHTPDIRVLEYDKERGYLWVAGKDIEGKDDVGNNILAGFIVTVAQLDGLLFPETVSAEEVETLEQDYAFELFPNPGSSFINIKANAAIGEIRIFDATGKHLNSIQSGNSATQVEVDVQNYNSCVYIFQTHMAEGVISKLVQIQK